MARIFISYRREDSGASAGRLHDRLREHFGRDNVFMDVDTIEPGLDFIEVIERTVASCDVLIALIGRQWLVLTDADGQRQLDHPEDFVRREIATALQRNIRVIPALIQDTPMPRATQLPENLQPLARRNSLELSDMHFHRDVDALIVVLDRVLGTAPSHASPAGASGTTTSLLGHGHGVAEVTEGVARQEETFATRLMRHLTNRRTLVGTSIVAVMIIGGVYLSGRIPQIALLRDVPIGCIADECSLTSAQVREIQQALCLDVINGVFDNDSRAALGEYRAGLTSRSADRRERNAPLSVAEGERLQSLGPCQSSGFLSAFERARLHESFREVSIGGDQIELRVERLQAWVKRLMGDQAPTLRGSIPTLEVRQAIESKRQGLGITTGAKDSNTAELWRRVRAGRNKDCVQNYSANNE